VRLFAAVWLVCALAQAATVRDVQTGSAANDAACAITTRATSFDSASAQIFVRFVAQNIRAGDRLRIDWVNPQGEVSSTVAYDELPTAPALCFLSALPVGGFAPASSPGPWQARIVVNGAAIHQQPFQITGQTHALSARVVSVQNEELVIEAAGTTSETSINIAQYTPAGGWKYILVVLPEKQEGNRMTIRTPVLAAAEYLVILRNPDGALSSPARFVVSTGGGYRMPTLANERWRISQGPYGSYSHWGRSIHAYDIAPIDARYVAAMRPGTVFAHDLGYGQTPHLRIFGNYITLRHDDGEFSHYAHLKTGTFRVRTGDRVEAGQVLAEVGTSGYSFGRHVHVHITNSPSISAQSLPFQFDQKPTGALLTSTRKPAAAKPAPPTKPRWTGALAFAGWWDKLLTVPRGSKLLEVRLGWDNQSHSFDLYLTSPSGQTIRPEKETITIPTPQPGPRRVTVQATRGTDATLPFWIEPTTR
jgi:hypothetical protein